MTPTEAEVLAAREAAREGSRGGMADEPRISTSGYDRSPDRIAWVVRVAGAQGEARTLLVTGDEVSRRKENE